MTGLQLFAVVPALLAASILVINLRLIDKAVTRWVKGENEEMDFEFTVLRIVTLVPLWGVIVWALWVWRVVS